jgi:hypothetical protein
MTIDDKLKIKMSEKIDESLELHVHDDVKYMAFNTKCPFSFAAGADVYIMQQDRIVFVGGIKQAKGFIHREIGKYKNNCFPI